MEGASPISGALNLTHATDQLNLRRFVNCAKRTNCYATCNLPPTLARRLSVHKSMSKSIIRGGTHPHDVSAHYAESSRCTHPSDKVTADILQGDWDRHAVRWCRICGSFQVVVNPIKSPGRSFVAGYVSPWTTPEESE